MLLKRRTPWWAAIAGIVVATLVLLAGEPASAAVTRTYGYEYGMSGWQLGYDGDRAWSMERSTERAYSGRYSVECYLDGTTGFGTAWLTRGYPAPIDTLIGAMVTVRLWSPERSDVNQGQVVAYVGTVPPTRGADFEVIGMTNAVAGWQEYRFERVQLTAQWPARVWVAFGVASVWEYTGTYYMDQVTVSLTP